MSDTSDRCVIAGKPLPFREDNEVVELAEFFVDDSNLRIRLIGTQLGDQSCECQVWEHTIYELESLALALRSAADQSLPQNFSVDRPDGWISEAYSLPLAATIELGYALNAPEYPRAYACVSLFTAKRRQLVLMSLAVQGFHNAVVIEPQDAEALASWLDRRISIIIADQP